jgi:hypothetical protein
MDIIGNIQNNFVVIYEIKSFYVTLAEGNFFQTIYNEKIIIFPIVTNWKNDNITVLHWVVLCTVKDLPEEGATDFVDGSFGRWPMAKVPVLLPGRWTGRWEWPLWAPNDQFWLVVSPSKPAACQWLCPWMVAPATWLIFLWIAGCPNICKGNLWACIGSSSWPQHLIPVDRFFFIF